jgi:hypothetical protein
MTLDGRAGGALIPVPLNYLHMVLLAVVVVIVLVVTVSVLVLVVPQKAQQIRWFSFEWFKHEALAEFDFVWRMDVDLWLKFPVRHFVVTAKNNCNERVFSFV